ncbi:MAG TPA: biotin--[acetyl-CoA-carboxylase] ligase [Polyangia bacterium]|nr:biotin--[acetyl-CoA-carboxylase] ligase [Polyangia bacterium]
MPADLVKPRLETRWLGRSYEWHEECGSTNDLAAARAREGAPEGLVIAAEAQTRGRGRLGRSWHSPVGESLYFSILLRPTRPTSEIPPLTLLAGAAVAGALAGLGFSPKLKWPNDVQLDGGRKVAGILTEMSSEGARASHVVVGIGLNVNATAFPPELEGRATSLRLARGGEILDRGAVLAAVLAAFEPLYERFAAEGAAIASAAWQEHAALGARARVGALEGLTLGVDPDGALRLRDDAGHVHRILSGEITT